MHTLVSSYLHCLRVLQLALGQTLASYHLKESFLCFFLPTCPRFVAHAPTATLLKVMTSVANLIENHRSLIMAEPGSRLLIESVAPVRVRLIDLYELACGVPPEAKLLDALPALSKLEVNPCFVDEKCSTLRCWIPYP